jgi:hypothetical protein
VLDWLHIPSLPCKNNAKGANPNLCQRSDANPTAGAFTGGFSAGYFNTVGSKEGWAPSTFKSSRDNRAGDGKRVQQTATDFMDDEERAELQATSLEARDDYDTFGRVVTPGCVI